jgi:hypothetical protein
MRPELSSDAFPERFVSEFSGYSRPSRDDTAVIVCHFSPIGFRRPAENARRVVSDMRESGIPVYSIELVHEGRKPELVDPDLRVSARSFMFHKENLMNLMLGRVPDKYSKVVFLDADVRFNDREWIDRVSVSLDGADIIQPMEWCFWSSTRSKMSAAEQLSRGGRLDVGHTHPGFATAARRDWLDRVGGLYDMAVVGNGDACLWHAVAQHMGLGFPEDSASPYLSKYRSLGEYVGRVSATKPRVGSMRGCFAGHMPHGTAKKRGYVERHSLFEKDISVGANSDGVHEWSDPSNDATMLSYFASRDEDNLTTQDSLHPHMDEDTLEFFLESVKKANVYVEYGAGGSTAAAFRTSKAKIISVESDKWWLDMVYNFMPGDTSRVDACHIDLGKVTNWGFPMSPNVDGSVYCSWPWTRTNKADLVLVDGRFRVACLVKTLIEAEPGTTVIFEDYVGRDFYHAAEKVTQPKRKIGRSALFVVPNSLDRNLADIVLKRHLKDPR